jgi:hypothetical protein
LRRGRSDVTKVERGKVTSFFSLRITTAPAERLAATIAEHVGLPLGLEARGPGREAERLGGDRRRRASA